MPAVCRARSGTRPAGGASSARDQSGRRRTPTAPAPDQHSPSPPRRVPPRPCVPASPHLDPTRVQPTIGSSESLCYTNGMTEPSVIVVGGGYGGFNVARAVDDFARVTLIEPRDTFH